MSELSTFKEQLHEAIVSVESDTDEISFCVNDWDKVKAIVDKIVVNDSASYLGGMLLVINSNDYEAFATLLAAIANADATTVTDARKFVILKRLLVLSAKLNHSIKLKLTKSIWSMQGFRLIFKYFMNNTFTAQQEKTNGPFCSLFSNSWGDDFETYIESLKPLIEDQSTSSHLIKYMERFASLNYNFVEDIYKVEETCSSVDFNIYLVRLMIELQNYVPESNTVLHNLYKEVMGRVINILYISLVAIEKQVHMQYLQLKGTQHESHVKLSLERISKIMSVSSIKLFVQNNVNLVCDGIETELEFYNMCQYAESGRLAFSTSNVLRELKPFILSNEMAGNIITLYITLAAGDNVQVLEPEEIRKLMLQVLSDYSSGNTEIMDNPYTFECYVNLLKKYSNVLSKLGDQSNLMLIYKHSHNITKNIPDEYVKLFRKEAHKTFLDVTRSLMPSLSSVERLTAMNNAIYLHILYVEPQTASELNKDLCKVISQCQLSKQAIDATKAKLSKLMTQDLATAIDESIQVIEINNSKIMDHIVKDREISNPIFFELNGTECVIDSTTLYEQAFVDYVQGALTVSNVEAYNKQGSIITKKINFMMMKNIKSSS